LPHVCLSLAPYDIRPPFAVPGRPAACASAEPPRFAVSGVDCHHATLLFRRFSRRKSPPGPVIGEFFSLLSPPRSCFLLVLFEYLGPPRSSSPPPACPFSLTERDLVLLPRGVGHPLPSPPAHPMFWPPAALAEIAQRTDFFSDRTLPHRFCQSVAFPRFFPFLFFFAFHVPWGNPLSELALRVSELIAHFRASRFDLSLFSKEQDHARRKEGRLFLAYAAFLPIWRSSFGCWFFPWFRFSLSPCPNLLLRLMFTLLCKFPHGFKDFARL